MANEPWLDEPDRDSWIHAELFCTMLRHPEVGHWCGYVGVTKEHPLFDVSYSECSQETCEDSYCEHSPEALFEVHGGITFSGESAEIKTLSSFNDEELPIKVWWFGFDHAHAGDLCPKMPYTYSMSVYRSYAYVKEQVNNLAEQIAKIQSRD